MTYSCTLLTLNNRHIMEILKSCEEKIKGFSRLSIDIYLFGNILTVNAIRQVLFVIDDGGWVQ